MQTKKKSPLTAKIIAVGFLDIVAACAAVVVFVSDVPTLSASIENLLAGAAAIVAIGCTIYIIIRLGKKVSQE